MRGEERRGEEGVELKAQLKEGKRRSEDERRTNSWSSGCRAGLTAGEGEEEEGERRKKGLAEEGRKEGRSAMARNDETDPSKKKKKEESYEAEVHIDGMEPLKNRQKKKYSPQPKQRQSQLHEAAVI